MPAVDWVAERFELSIPPSYGGGIPVREFHVAFPHATQTSLPCVRRMNPFQTLLIMLCSMLLKFDIPILVAWAQDSAQLFSWCLSRHLFSPMNSRPQASGSIPFCIQCTHMPPTTCCFQVRSFSSLPLRIT